jgi:hypothetical protein
VIVDAGEDVLEIAGDSVGDARDQEHSLFASGTGQMAGGEGGDRGCPVDSGHLPAVGEPAAEGDEPGCEVGAVQPGPVGDEELGGGFEAVDPLGLVAQGRRKPGWRCREESLAGAVTAGSSVIRVKAGMPMPTGVAGCERLSIWASLSSAPARQDNEQWHLLILQDLAQRQGLRQSFVRHRLAPWLIAFLYYHVSWLLFVLRPKWKLPAQCRLRGPR